MTSLPDALAACARQAGLQQRVRLLDAIWDDVQGERRAVHAGILPAFLVTSALRMRASVEEYAADLLFCPDGVWRVARDRVERHPGASTLEAPVLAAFLPCLCRLLLGETLRLPSLPSWWLGEPGIRAILAADSRRYLIRGGLDPESEPIPLAGMSPARRHWLQTMVDADPSRFVAGLNLGRQAPFQRVTYDTGRRASPMYC